ncbi:iron(III) ABC transporter permease [Propionigenium maris DSM 9537]|uniref:Iron(III) ABC transporter permease n=1 Tax=Propionigenium maris DSM 9537 TaxID=1123000 RepID=A0A9W6GK49_9FUSO|nr:iron ABC transporter permease [Propionigenium maris]GLI55107.1 iron(III) ABC transporter permease [Propionigenium maris DSM 9537]
MEVNLFSLKLKTELKNMKKLFNDPILFSTIVFTLIVITLFILLPLMSILNSSFTYNGRVSLEHYKNIASMRENISILYNTLKLGVTTATLATVAGFFFAYGLTYVKLPVKRLFSSIAILPIISPPFVVALSAILLFGRRGFITRELLGIRNFDIYGFHGLVLVQFLTFFPVAYLMLVGLLSKIDPSVEEASRDLGASRWDVFRTVTLPLMMPGLANAFLVIFIQSIADFGNPMVIGGNYTVAAVQIYLQGIGNYDMGGATALSMVLLLISISIFVTQKYYISKKSYVTVTGKVAKKRELMGDTKVWLPIFSSMMALTVLVILMYILIPIGSFIKLWGVDYSLSLDNYRYVLNMGMKPIVDTTALALISTPITGLFAMIIAFLIVRKRFVGRSFIEFTTMMAIAIPGTIVGLGYVITYNKKPLVLTGTAIILVIAFIMRSMPIGIRSAMASLQQIDPSIEEAASVLGANSRKVFTSITLPMIKPAFFSGLIYAFVRSMTLVSTIIFLVSAKYNLLTVAIMNQIDVGKIGVASAYCTILIVIVAVMILVMKVVLKMLGINEISEN